MHRSTARVTTRGYKVTMEDAGVVGVGVATATYSWWQPIVEWIPDVLQGFVLCCTVVFVAARAVNEVRKFFRKD